MFHQFNHLNSQNSPHMNELIDVFMHDEIDDVHIKFYSELRAHALFGLLEPFSVTC